MNSDNQTDLYESVLDENLDTNDEKTEYKVVLKGLDKDRYETKSSFAIKLSLIAKVPVSRTKFMIKNTPSIIWKGKGKIKAKRFLSMIEESGGIGEISENKTGERNPENKSETKEAAILCAKCGFPLGKDDKFCSFCATPLAGLKSKRNIKIPQSDKSGLSVNYVKIVFLLIAVIVFILLIVLTN